MNNKAWEIGNVLATYALWPEFESLETHKGRKSEPTPQSYLLTNPCEYIDVKTRAYHLLTNPIAFGFLLLVRATAPSVIPRSSCPSPSTSPEPAEPLCRNHLGLRSTSVISSPYSILVFLDLLLELLVLPIHMSLYSQPTSILLRIYLLAKTQDSLVLPCCPFSLSF